MVNFPDKLDQSLALERINNVLDLTRVILSDGGERRMHYILSSVVDHIQTPTIIFQRHQINANRKPPSTEDELSDFCCLLHNRAFAETILQDNVSQIIGADLFQCFPQLYLKHSKILSLLMAHGLNHLRY